MKKRWAVRWYDVRGDEIREERFLTRRAAERAKNKKEHALPVWLPNLFSSLVERV